MVDIQSATTEIRWGKKEERRKKKPQNDNILAYILPVQLYSLKIWSNMHSKDFLVTVCKPAHGYDHGYFGFDHFII